MWVEWKWTLSSCYGNGCCYGRRSVMDWFVHLLKYLSFWINLNTMNNVKYLLSVHCWHEISACILGGKRRSVKHHLLLLIGIGAWCNCRKHEYWAVICKLIPVDLSVKSSHGYFAEYYIMYIKWKRLKLFFEISTLKIFFYYSWLMSRIVQNFSRCCICRRIGTNSTSKRLK